MIPFLVDNLDITSETIQEPFSDVISQQQPITHMGDSDSLNNLLSAVQHQHYMYKTDLRFILKKNKITY